MLWVTISGYFSLPGSLVQLEFYGVAIPLHHALNHEKKSRKSMQPSKPNNCLIIIWLHGMFVRKPKFISIYLVNVIQILIKAKQVLWRLLLNFEQAETSSDSHFL